MKMGEKRIAALAERRRLVAGLYIARTPINEIATAMDVATKTIVRDIEWLEALWHKELVTDPVAQRARDLAATNNLERSAARRFMESGDPVWWDKVMKALERRAKLLGLDKPQVGLPGSSPDHPLYVAQGEIDWDSLPDAVMDKMVALNAEILALQPASGGLIVEGEGTVVE